MTCPKCQRNHSGICGIPAGVVLGWGARVSSAARGDSPPVKSAKPKAKPLSTRVLRGVLTEAKTHHQKVMGLLKIMPSEVEEFTALLDREGTLAALISSLEGQIAVREGLR